MDSVEEEGKMGHATPGPTQNRPFVAHPVNAAVVARRVFSVEWSMPDHCAAASRAARKKQR